VTIPTSQAPGKLILQYQPAFVRQYQNLEDAYTAGLDFNAKWSPVADVSLSASYSLLFAHGNVFDEEEERLRGITIDGTARHKGSLAATWTHRFGRNYRLGVGLYGRASTTRHYEDFGNGKGFQLWRLSTTHDLGHSRQLSWKAELGVDNIFNYVDRTPHGRHLGTTTPGTTVYASLLLRFNKGIRTNFNKHYSTIKSNSYEED
jgi:outer membrane receptor for ferrienterochelin and colicins